jgi:hypothetical protein
MSTTYHIVILTNGKPKGMTVALANDEPCDIEQMKKDAISKFNAERVISVAVK